MGRRLKRIAASGSIAALVAAWRHAVTFGSAWAALLGAATSCAQPTYDAQRAALIAEIERDIERTSATTGHERLSDAVRTALLEVPRHEFVPAPFRAGAYSNRPLPIGEGQTISQPTIVALMTELADVDSDSIVLEIGTGSGYQAAVLAEIAREVYTIEIIDALGERAAATLRRLGYDNVHVKVGDGYRGWPEMAPFDAIVVTAAPDEMPEPLIRQLRPGGRLVAPIGPEGAVQSLRVLSKDAAGNVTSLDVLSVMFVPLTREAE
jgi:protein-L-isoaspartate(D-aspartate) O-methyltransferase